MNRKEVRKQLWLGGKFVLKLAVYSAFIYGLLFAASQWMESITAIGSALILNALGVHAHWSGNLILFSNKTAKIIELCTGSLELSILVGAVLATEDRKWRSRALGSAFAVVTLYIINIFRVGITLATAVWYGWKFADLIHTVLFKFFLVFAILGLYAIWYVWLSPKLETQSK